MQPNFKRNPWVWPERSFESISFLAFLHIPLNNEGLGVFASLDRPERRERKENVICNYLSRNGHMLLRNNNWMQLHSYSRNLGGFTDTLVELDLQCWSGQNSATEFLLLVNIVLPLDVNEGKFSAFLFSCQLLKEKHVKWGWLLSSFSAVYCFCYKLFKSGNLALARNGV